MQASWLVVGAVLSGPLWVGLSLLIGRRLWRNARKLAARARGQEQLAQLGQLAGGLAHEIRNPLSTITLNLQLLAEELTRHDDEDHRRLLNRLKSVQQESDRLRGTLDDFLQFAKRYELSPEVVDLRRLVGEVLDFFAAQADAARVVLRPALPDRAVHARVDANLIKQALLNLMINALQAMPDGGELIVKLDARKDEVVMEVIDTGLGIDAERIERIFEVGCSTKDWGTGLGLPTTQRILREHGGAIRVESEPGKGTRFILTLPLTKD